MATPFRLLLVRHGQTHGNVSGALDTGEPGKDLTDLGRAQAEAAAQALAEHDLDGLYVSRLVRTQQTADPLARLRTMAPAVQTGLEEVRAGAFEMRSDEEAVHGYLTTIAEWIGGNIDVRMPGAESGSEFLARYDAAVARIAARAHRSAVVVSHGAAIRTWVSRRVRDAEQHPAAMQSLHNTACITVEGHPESGWELVDWQHEPIGGRFLEDDAAPDPTAGGEE